MSQELLQPPSQPYIGCIGSSPDFIHHPHQSFGQSSMDHGEMFGHSNPCMTTHQTPHSKKCLCRTHSFCLNQVMLQVHHICLAPHL